MERLEPQGEFRDERENDRWNERGEHGQWVRVHRIPRVAMLSPFRIPRGPGRKTCLQSVRQTIGINEKGLQFDVTDDWTAKAPAHRALPARWTGIMTFRAIAHDDVLYGGDQWRQRERADYPVQPKAAGDSYARHIFLIGATRRYVIHFLSVASRLLDTATCA